MGSSDQLGKKHSQLLGRVLPEWISPGLEERRQIPPDQIRKGFCPQIHFWVIIIWELRHILVFRKYLSGCFLSKSLLQLWIISITVQNTYMEVQNFSTCILKIFNSIQLLIFLQGIFLYFFVKCSYPKNFKSILKNQSSPLTSSDN